MKALLLALILTAFPFALQSKKSLFISQPLVVSLQKSTPAHLAAAYEIESNQKNTEQVIQLTTLDTQKEKRTLELQPLAIHRDPPQKTMPIASGYTVAGQLELSGVGFGPQRHIEVFRQHEGQVLEKGDVDTENGNYSIAVQNKLGSLIAQVKDAQGKVHAQGVIPMESLKDQKISSGEESPSSKIIVAPITNEPSVARSFYPQRKLKPGSIVARNNRFKGTTDASGEFELPEDWAKGSQAVAQFTSPGHYPTSTVLSVGGPKSIEAYPIEWAKALRQIVSEQRQLNLEDPEGTIIFGRVLYEGKPRAGVTVELESEQENQVVYFNDWLLPDSELKTTSASGYFAFLGAKEGYHSLLARVGELYYSHSNLVTQKGAVAHVELKSSLKTALIPVRVFDAFTGEAQPAHVLHQGQPEELEISVAQPVYINSLTCERDSLIQVNPMRPYLPSTLATRDRDEQLFIPLIREDWLLALRDHFKMPSQLNESTVVGFSGEKLLQVEFIEPHHEKVSVIYFDRRGQPSQEPIRGGGFVIFGLISEQGYVEVSIKDLEQNRSHERVIPIDQNSVFTLKVEESP